MATEMGDEEFAKRARAIAETGSKNIDGRLFNGEYVYQRPRRIVPRPSVPTTVARSTRSWDRAGRSRSGWVACFRRRTPRRP